MWCDNHRMDLLTIWPRAIAQDPDIGEASQTNIWTHARLAGGKHFVGVAVWNGLGSFWWSDEPSHKIDEEGYYVISEGLATDEPLHEMDMFSAVRHWWIHGMRMNLDTELWMPERDKDLYDLLAGHRNGLDYHPQSRKLEADVKQLIGYACQSGLEIYKRHHV